LPESTKYPLNIIIESEQILASEFTSFDNHVWQTVNLEVLTISVLKFICDRHNVPVNFDNFIARMGIREIGVNRTYTRIADEYKDNRMPKTTKPSTTVFTMLCA